jgi:hypothetical protein
VRASYTTASLPLELLGSNKPLCASKREANARTTIWQLPQKGVAALRDREKSSAVEIA